MIYEKKLVEKRLTEAYNKAKIEYFDNNSKYIFFSDCHRGDCTPSDEFAKNQNIFPFHRDEDACVGLQSQTVWLWSNRGSFLQ